ncbi:Crp/Fnr family transcriptional regulator [Asticcacaulis sp. BYS171W]|uniref:Crp/Fnr family transcriptional regulator n=1 Tax=Asticcacaulis aquaticus TaxID=2984212 RepID=A0ABT5HZM4_9CAUL|nr:Crp/Fnr family transcriptional regulator [Asticcacaulis aquaticus]MDC7684876.1 Crp/Fnr family transcriptional regulator [Asticcacaulis aquaticus]
MTLSVAPMMTGSNLLMALQPGDRKLLQAHFELVEVGTGDVLFEAGDIVRYAWFPLGATLASFMVLLDDARGVETALIGREGAIGGIVSQGRLPAFSRAQVQFAGPMLRIEVAELERAKLASLSLRHFFARYADCLLAQVFQAVACNATHTIEQRAARWLSSAIDRTGDNVIPLTQEQLAGMLGVGRSYVGRVMGAMKRAGVLETVRSRIFVHSQDDLRRLSCGCNALVQAHFDEVLKGVYPESSENVAE